MAYFLNVGSSVPIGVFGDVASSFLFASVNSKVATVSTSGLVSAVAPGTACILMMRKSDRAIRRVVINVKSPVTNSTAFVMDASGNPVAVQPFVLKVNNKAYGGRNNFKELRQVVAVPPPPADTTPPNSPSYFAAFQNGPGAPIDLSWSAVQDAVRYELQKLDSMSGDWVTQESELVGLSWADNMIGSGDTFDYRIRAFDAAGNASGWETTMITTYYNMG